VKYLRSASQILAYFKTAEDFENWVTSIINAKNCPVPEKDGFAAFDWILV
jgi:hypothetical protein